MNACRENKQNPWKKPTNRSQNIFGESGDSKIGCFCLFSFGPLCYHRQKKSTPKDQLSVALLMPPHYMKITDLVYLFKYLEQRHSILIFFSFWFSKLKKQIQNSFTGSSLCWPFIHSWHSSFVKWNEPCFCFHYTEWHSPSPYAFRLSLWETFCVVITCLFIWLNLRLHEDFPYKVVDHVTFSISDAILV